MVLWLVDLVIEVASHSESNLMDIDALSICFAINLLRSVDPETLVTLQTSSKAVFKKMCLLRQSNQLILEVDKMEEQKAAEQGVDQEVEEEEKEDMAAHRR